MLDFRIDWGYQYLYSRRHYHPIYIWDGDLACDNGKITGCWQLEYPVIWYGPGHSARETRLDAPRWRSRTRRGMAGIRVEAEVDPDAVFTLTTCSGIFTFTAEDIEKRGRVVFPVGPKYLGCHVIVTRSRHYWFRPAPRSGELTFEADDLEKFGLAVHDWARMRTAWLSPGGKLQLPFTSASVQQDVGEELLHLEAMAAPEYTPGNERQVHGYIPLRVAVDGRIVAERVRFFRHQDRYMQLLEDMWIRFPAVSPGEHILELSNCHDNTHFLLSRVTLSRHEFRHGQLSLPEWALAGEPLLGSVYAARPDILKVSAPDGEHLLEAIPGWNDFAFSLPSGGTEFGFSCLGCTGRVGACFELPEETPPVTVGLDLTVVPHDDNGDMDWTLNYLWRTRLGNMVVFRSLLYDENRGHRKVAPELLARWGKYCREHHIHVEAASDFDDGALVKESGDMFHSAGRHEWPGAVYAFDPDPEWGSNDMREAMEHYLKYLRIEIDRAHRAAPRSAFGDASGGHRYCYLAGADFIRSETMVAHTQHLCSQARPAAEALGDGEWGVHIAIQHARQPFFDDHLGQYFLSLYQPWAMGANMLYEEDSLFLLFKEERQCWNDCLTRGKRKITRDFFRFAKTHPRKGETVRRIAFLEGRFAAPFNGFICGSEQTPDYSVWGRFGNNAPEWGHRQPEKCRHLLDVLMPGASTLPLRQRFERRRFFFSGTPYGDFDEVPIEADAAYLRRYALLLNLGWNTMNESDYRKLTDFVRNGGTLLTGLPQFSTHVGREFLRDMEDLALYNGGDLSELCGVRVKGRSALFSGTWNGPDRTAFPDPELSSLPNSSPNEDGPCRLAEVELCGAEPVAWDADNGAPVVVRYKLGAGCVYLFTVWAYPGHQDFQQTAAAWIAGLSERAMGNIRVIDPSGEVFWNLRRHPDGVVTVTLLNTDWSTPGNVKDVTLRTQYGAFPLQVRERRISLLTMLPDGTLLEAAEPERLHLDRRGDGLHAFGTGKQELVRHNDGKKMILDFAGGTEMLVRL
jgi:hypothetical protein